MKSVSKKLDQRDAQALIMDRKTYNKIDHSVPYVFSIQKDSHNLVYFGGNHCFKAENEQNTQIEDLRKNFIEKPNPKKHAFIEANILKPFSSKEESISKAGESGLLARLATQENISFSCPEPPRIEEVQYLEKFFSKRDILYSYYGIRLGQWHRQDKEKNWEIYCSKVLDFFNTFPGREKEIISVEKIMKIHEKLFHTNFDPLDKNHRTKLNNPTINYSITNDISRKSDDVREKYILKNIIKKRDEGYDIFVVYGCSHAVIEEKAIKQFCC